MSRNKGKSSFVAALAVPSMTIARLCLILLCTVLRVDAQDSSVSPSPLLIPAPTPSPSPSEFPSLALLIIDSFYFAETIHVSHCEDALPDLCSDPAQCHRQRAVEYSLQNFPYTADKTLFGSTIGVFGESFPIYRFCVPCGFQGAYTPPPSDVGMQYIGKHNGDNLRFIIILDEIISQDVHNDPTLFTVEIMEIIINNNVTADFIRGTMTAATMVRVKVNAFIISYMDNSNNLICELLVISDPTANIIPSTPAGRCGLQTITSTNLNGCPNFVAEVQAEETTFDKCSGNDIIDISETCVNDVSARYTAESSAIVERNTQVATFVDTTVTEIITTQLRFTC